MHQRPEYTDLTMTQTVAHLLVHELPRKEKLATLCVHVCVRVFMCVSCVLYMRVCCAWSTHDTHTHTRAHTPLITETTDNFGNTCEYC